MPQQQLGVCSAQPAKHSTEGVYTVQGLMVTRTIVWTTAVYNYYCSNCNKILQNLCNCQRFYSALPPSLYRSELGLQEEGNAEGSHLRIRKGGGGNIHIDVKAHPPKWDH
jgi:hypothetical protein